MIKQSAILVLALATTGSAFAGMYDVSSFLQGTNEVPANASPAFGSVTGTYDDVTNLLILDTVVQDLTAATSAAHLHRGAAGVNGPVTFPLSGAVGSTTFSSHDEFTLTATQETDLLGTMFYVNVHSSAFPGGEVRGQLVANPVPEPATLAVLGLGVAFIARRKRKA